MLHRFPKENKKKRKQSKLSVRKLFLKNHLIRLSLTQFLVELIFERFDNSKNFFSFYKALRNSTYERSTVFKF